MQLHELALADLELRHEVVVAVLGRRALRAHRLADQRREFVVKGEQLVLAQRVELGEAAHAPRDPGVEAEAEGRRAVLVVVEHAQLVRRVGVGVADELQRLGVGRRRHRRGDLELGVVVQPPLPPKVREQVAVLLLVVGHAQLAARQVVRHHAVVRGVAEAVKVEHDVGVGQRPHHVAVLAAAVAVVVSHACGGVALVAAAATIVIAAAIAAAAAAAALREEVEEEAAHARGRVSEGARVRHVDGGAVAAEDGAARLAEEGEEVRLEVARVPRLLRRHPARVARVVDQEVRLEIEGRLARLDAIEAVGRRLVDLAPERVDAAARAVGVGPGVVVLVLRQVLVVAVPALEQHVAHELPVGIGVVDEAQPRLERVIVDEAVVAEDLEGGEVGVDAAGDQHALIGHVLQQVLVQHVLPIVEHVLQHPHIWAQRSAEKLRHRVVVGVPLVEVALLRKKQERRKGVRVAIQPHIPLRHVHGLASKVVGAVVLRVLIHRDAGAAALLTFGHRFAKRETMGM